MFKFIVKPLIECLTLIFIFTQTSFAGIYFVSTAGSDPSGDGSSLHPWRTLKYAVTKVSANQGHTIYVGAGTFVETGPVEIPPGISIEGAGIDQTVFKANSSLFYHPSTDPGYSTDKFLISLSNVNPGDGNQVLRHFTVDGDSKQLHGGVYVRYRNHVVIDQVKVINTNYTGIWLWDVKDVQLSNTQLINCSWGNTGYSSGALNVGNLERVHISKLTVDEDEGYGIKAIGPDGYNDIFHLTIRDCHISVTPFGLWNDGTSPNLSIELWQSTLVGCEIYNSYVDNTISLVNGAVPATGTQTIRVHHNFIDIDSRAHGQGYGIELSIHDAEIDHNYFLRGGYGIANWDNPMQNWSIHHNTFYALQEATIGEVVRSQWSGLHHVSFYNNTIEFTGNQTMNVFGLYGSASENIDIKNNLVINSSTGYSSYPNQLIHTANGATIIGSTLQILNNSLANLDPGELINTLLGLPIPNPLIKLLNLPNPVVTRSGNRPTPFYVPAPGSSLINAGKDVGFPYAGSAPDIGAFESGSLVVPNQPPLIDMVSPAYNATYPKESKVHLAAYASDPDGSIAKVEFFNGSTKLGESTSSPYEFIWSGPPPGRHSLTVVATDNQNASTVSQALPMTITSGELLDDATTGIVFGLFAPDATLDGGMILLTDPTATRGSSFAMPEGNGVNDAVPPPASATFYFELPVSDSMLIWVRIKSQATGRLGYFVNRGQVWTRWQADVGPEWNWVKITDPATDLPLLFPFSEGINTFGMGWLNDNVQVDRIMLTNDRNFEPPEATPETSATLYPNPAEDQFFLEFSSDLSGLAEVLIWDVGGKLVSHSSGSIYIGINTFQIKISDLSNGLYVVVLRINGKKKHALRLIAHH